jgi:hypothetical protein
MILDGRSAILFLFLKKTCPVLIHRNFRNKKKYPVFWEQEECFPELHRQLLAECGRPSQTFLEPNQAAVIRQLGSAVPPPQ